MEVSPLIGLVLFHQLRHSRGVKPDGLPSHLLLDIRVESVAWNLARHGRQAVVPELRIELVGWIESLRKIETSNRRCLEGSKWESWNEKLAASLLGSSHTSHWPGYCKFLLRAKK